MKFIKKKVLNLPFLLLLSFIVFLITKQTPSTADSIIVGALSLLYGSTFYFESIEQPDLQKIILELETKLSNEISVVRNDMSAVNMSIRSSNAPEKRISF